MKSKVVALAVVLATAGALAACGDDSDSASTDTAATEETATTEDTATEDTAAAEEAPAESAGPDLSALSGKTIGIISLAPGLEPVDRLQAGVVECAEANGGSTQVFDAKGGTEAVQAFEQANNAGVDAIYNVANDIGNGSLDAALKAAGDAGRPVVTVWGGQRTGSYSITGLEFQSAARVGQYVIDRIAAENGGTAAGDVLIVNARVTPSLRQRADAFKAMVGQGSEYPDIEVTEVEVDLANAVADAQAKVEQAFQANPDIKAVYASFDSLGQGAAAAVDGLGNNAFVVSFNGDSSALDLIRAGKSFAATAANDLEGTASLGCELLAKLISGETPEATTYWMDSPLVTDKNVPASGFATGPGSFTLFNP
ncbi:MAG: sugar ABC transporter substrate-binding protein [Ilumatobacteraceae bacterium]